MKIQFAFVSFILALLLSGCIVRPAHKVHPVKVKVPVRTVVMLDNEHTAKHIVIVKTKPAKKKKCWAHNNHWHCNK